MQESETLKQFEMWTMHSEDKANGVERRTTLSKTLTYESSMRQRSSQICGTLLAPKLFVRLSVAISEVD